MDGLPGLRERIDDIHVRDQENRLEARGSVPSVANHEARGFLSADGLRQKISDLCDVPIDGVINAPDATRRR